ncbi:unnamed protein product [Calypogeia fissa]
MGEEKAAPSTASNDEEDVYWVGAGSDSLGIVVATTWMLSKPRQVQKHAHLHASCGWDTLVAHPYVLNIWAPSWARALAIRVLDKLVQEVKERPRPIVFATFSGGMKSCLYQILKILDECYEGVDSNLTQYRILRDCYAGQIHDSSPADYVGSVGANFVSNPAVLGFKKKHAAITWSAHAVAKTLNYFFLPRFERERADMWDIIYKTAAWGPVLVLCSKDDDVVPFEVIDRYTSRLSDLGCKVTTIVWDNSPHVGHLKTHPDKYRSAVTAFLSDAAGLFTLKVANTSTDGSHGRIRVLIPSRM